MEPAVGVRDVPVAGRVAIEPFRHDVETIVRSDRCHIAGYRGHGSQLDRGNLRAVGERQLHRGSLGVTRRIEKHISTPQNGMRWVTRAALFARFMVSIVSCTILV